MIHLSDLQMLIPDGKIIEGILAMTVKFLELIINKIYEKNKKINLKAHSIFSRANLNKSNIMMYFTLENKGKEIVFKDILCAHMDIFKKNANILCDEHLTEKITNSEQLYTRSIEIMNNILIELKSFYINDDSYTIEEKIALCTVMKKYDHWNIERQLDIESRIREICNSAFYPNLNSKMVAILDAFMFTMNDIVSDANKTLNNINGDLKGLTFKGVEI